MVFKEILSFEKEVNAFRTREVYFNLFYHLKCDAKVLKLILQIIKPEPKREENKLEFIASALLDLES